LDISTPADEDYYGGPHYAHMLALCEAVAPKAELRLTTLPDSVPDEENILHFTADLQSMVYDEFIHAIRVALPDRENLSDLVISMSLGNSKAIIADALFSRIFLFEDTKEGLDIALNEAFFAEDAAHCPNYQAIFGALPYGEDDILEAVLAVAAWHWDEEEQSPGDLFEECDLSDCSRKERRIMKAVLQRLIDVVEEICARPDIAHARDRWQDFVADLTARGAIFNLSVGNDRSILTNMAQLDLNIPADFVLNRYAAPGMMLVANSDGQSVGPEVSRVAGDCAEQLPRTSFLLPSSHIISTSEAAAIASGLSALLKQISNHAIRQEELDCLLGLRGEREVTHLLDNARPCEQGAGVLDIAALFEEVFSRHQGQRGYCGAS
jgi:hypothetical protein